MHILFPAWETPAIWLLAASFNMFSRHYIPFEESKTLGALVLDYIRKKETLKDFYFAYPDKEGFEKIIKSNSWQELNRSLLAEILASQASLVGNSSNVSLQNIKSLSDKKTFAVTTGHQLCLFTGPLYFIYKILTAINLCDPLKKLFPDYDFVPVYWMAGEDHDFEEVNHFHLFGKTLRWESAQKGAVGDFSCEGLDKTAEELRTVLGNSEHAKALSDLFEKTYLKHADLKSATRYLVNELFGKYGIVTVDGNDVRFKSQAKELFRKDIFEQKAFDAVNKSVEKLDRLGYEQQVNPRPVNCFYIEKNLRGRIDKEDGHFKIAGADLSFSQAQMESLIEEHPEKLSPNVVLRPVYQQLILPNIAYVGGPGEIAYWLEYRSMFETLKTQMPVLFLRSFISIIDKKTKSRIDKTGLEIKDFFLEEIRLVDLLQKKSGKTFEAESEKESLTKIFDELKNKISEIDPTLGGAVSAEQQKALKAIENLEHKANKALKQQSENEISQVKTVRQKLFPENIPQERYENFSSLVISWGLGLISQIKENIDPFSCQHMVLTED
jgi:bacillithiol biosynthesis cysteine-adding enzyme BshC